MSAPAASADETVPAGSGEPGTTTPPPPPAEDTRVLELYKTAVEMADRVSARRATANAFFLTAQSALVAVIGLATPALLKVSWWTALAVSLAGVTLSASWWLQLRSYRDLNRAKFVVINKIEEDLPVRVFTDEWTAIQQDAATGKKRRYIRLGTTERFVPWIFAVLYALLFLGRVLH